MNLERTEEKHRHKIILITGQVHPSKLSYPVSLECVSRANCTPGSFAWDLI
jgi:hypothetical protein